MNPINLGEVGIIGELATWQPASRPHALLVGPTGSGKTFLARQLARQASICGNVWIADGKGGGDFSSEKVERLASGPIASTKLILDAADAVKQRLSTLSETGGSTTDEQPLWIFIDELSAIQLRFREEDNKTHKDRRELLIGALTELVLTGRAAQAFVVIITQRPDADSSLPGAVRDQLGLRIALGWMSPDGYRMVFGQGDVRPPERLQHGVGWISGHVGHHGAPSLFFATTATERHLESQRHWTWLRWNKHRRQIEGE